MGIVQLKYVTIKKFSELTGYTEKAVQTKIQRGVFIEGIHYRHSPDSRIQMDMGAYYLWVEGQKLSEALKQAAIESIA